MTGGNTCWFTSSCWPGQLGWPQARRKINLLPSRGGLGVRRVVREMSLDFDYGEYYLFNGFNVLSRMNNG